MFSIGWRYILKKRAKAKKAYPVFLDLTANNWEEISISAGQRGLQIILAPADLQSATKAKIAPLIMHNSESV